MSVYSFDNVKKYGDIKNVKQTLTKMLDALDPSAPNAIIMLDKPLLATADCGQCELSLFEKEILVIKKWSGTEIYQYKSGVCKHFQAFVNT